jgi:hypothetical protein
MFRSVLSLPYVVSLEEKNDLHLYCFLRIANTKMSICKQKA